MIKPNTSPASSKTLQDSAHKINRELKRVFRKIDPAFPPPPTFKSVHGLNDDDARTVRLANSFQMATWQGQVKEWRRERAASEERHGATAANAALGSSNAQISPASATARRRSLEEYDREAHG